MKYCVSLLETEGKTANSDAEKTVVFKTVFRINYGKKQDDAFMPHNDDKLFPVPTVSEKRRSIYIGAHRLK